MHKRMRFIPIVVIIVVVVLGGYWWTTRVTAADGSLKASGTIEATDVTVSPEIGGRVVEVLAAEGDHLDADQVVVRLDDRLQQAQLKQLEAAVAAAQAQQRAAQAQQQAAQANYDLLKAGPLIEQVQAAQEAVKTAEANVASAQAQYDQLKKGARAADIAAAEAAVAQAAAQRKVALDTHDKTMQCVTVPGRGEVCPGLGTREEQARAALEAAEEAYAAAESRLNQLKRGATKEELAAAQGRVDAATAQHNAARAQLAQVEKGARPEQLSAAQAQIAVAQAQIDAAAAQIASAQAQIDVLKVQIDKLTLKAPRGGTVLNRSIEPGEIVAPGAKLLSVADTANLYMTVYVPENRYGEIALGATVQVSVDSFPGETFAATVTRIADKAEFTPRNVQTAEGRATTVFAVKLSLDNAGGKLKSGMPADVVFGK